MGVDAVHKNAWSFVLDEPAKVLVADDDPILLEFAAVHLSSPAAVIETALDGAAAWAMLTSRDFDIALVDIEMPPPNGFSLLEQIRADARLRHLPVIMLTGHEDIASIDRAFQLGANSFVTKPVNWRLLSYHVRYILRASHVERELRRAHRQAETRDASRDSTLLALEIECQSVLRSIRERAQSCGSQSPDSPAQSDHALRQIEALAAGALRRWDELTDAMAHWPTAAFPCEGQTGDLESMSHVLRSS